MAAPASSAEAKGSRASSLPKILFLAVLTIPLLTGGLLSWHSMGTLDIWLHNRVGEDILAGNGFPTTNTYSFTEPDYPWTNHEWLFQVAVAMLGPEPGDDPAQGINRWNVLRIGLSLALLGILVLGDKSLARARSKPGPGWTRCWLAMPLLLGLMLLWPRLILRPELVSYVLFVLVVRALDPPGRSWTPQADWTDLLNPGRPLGRVLWLTVLWSQFHGFSSLGPAVLFLAILGRMVESALGWPKETKAKPEKRIFWWLSLPLLLGGLCLSPTGVQGLLYPLRALGQFQSPGIDLQTTISELVPLLKTRDSLGYTMMAYKVSLVWGVIWVVVTWGRTSLLRVLLWSLAAAAAYAGQRNIGFYGVAFILLHTGTTGAPLLHRLPASWRNRSGPLVGLAGFTLALAVAIPWWVQIANDDFYLTEGVSRRFGAEANPGRYPESAARILARSPAARLFTNVDAAAYLLDRSDARLFIDGRTEAYSSGLWATYEQIKQGGPQALDLLAKANPDRVFISTGGGAFRALAKSLLQDQHWILTHHDETGLLFQASGPTAAPSTVPERAKALTTLVSVLPRPDTELTTARAADLSLSWAIVMELEDNPELQEQALRRGLEFRPNHPTLQHNLGNLLLARDDPAGALPRFEGALRVNRQLGGSALNAGVCLLRLGETAKARQMFRRATHINPRSFEAWANLSVACQALQDQSGALSAMERAVELQPGNQRLRNQLIKLRSSR